MANQREIKRRIKSAKNIGQVTSALEMVSAVKMRKAQSAALASRPFSETLHKALFEIGDKIKESENLFLSQPEETKVKYVVIVASQKGLVGSMLTNLGKRVFKYTLDNKNLEIKAVTWGKKARSMATKAKITVVADFSEEKGKNIYERISALTTFLREEFVGGRVDVVEIIYSKFVNTMTQQPEVIQYLPLFRQDLGLGEKNNQAIFTFEPDPNRVLNAILERYIEQVMTQVILDSLAAEHSARMIAMKNAHDNATDIASELTLLYNKSRQAAITNEIADIASGSLVGR